MRMFYRVSAHGSHKQARGVYGARAGKENIFLTYKQVMKIFSLPTCSGVRDLPPPCCVLEQDTLLPESTG